VVCYNLRMDFKMLPIQKILLVLFVLGISLMTGWFSQRAVEKFIINSEMKQVETL